MRKILLRYIISRTKNKFSSGLLDLFRRVYNLN